MSRPCPGLRYTPSLSQDERNAWRSVLHLAVEKNWHSDEVVFSPGSMAQGLYYVTSGQLRTVAFGPSGTQRVLWVMEADSFFGEIAMFSGKPCIHFMETMTPSVTYYFSASLLYERILPTVPQINTSLLRILAEKLRQQSSDIQAKTFFSATSLIASFLLEKMPQQFENTCLIRVSHTELAELLGLHRVTVSKGLARMRDKDLLLCTHEGIVITDPAGLRQITCS